ncbi:MAG: hypothetical protein EOO24_26165 [Comamonadaceae bacterium]|nr:MAG: hypothetical protein EOO24_26165 [Comamonadaceae bacterium]
MARPAHDDDQQEAPPAATESRPPFWEWVAAGIGLVLLLACVGYLTVQAVTSSSKPPDPVVQVTSVHAQGSRWLVVLRVHNRGDQTAEALKVTGELKQAGQLLERAETEFQFLPGGSSRDGGLFFSRDPQGVELVVRPESYQAP